jgi:hypothetical protein
MKPIDSTFKKEAVWMVVFSLAPAVIGILIVLISIFVRN